MGLCKKYSNPQILDSAQCLAPTESSITPGSFLILTSFHSKKISSQSMGPQQSGRIPAWVRGAQVMPDSAGTHREAGVGVNLILGCYSEASVTVSCCPGEIDGRLQLLVHLLVNGATKLCPVVSANKHSTDAQPPRKAG